MNCTCDGSTTFNCKDCLIKPAKTDTKRIIKIYALYRLAELNNKDNLFFGEYWRTIMQDHLSKIIHFTTIKEIDQDIKNHMSNNKTFSSWFNMQIGKEIEEEEHQDQDQE